MHLRQHIAALSGRRRLVPPGAPVMASNTVGGHLSAREYVYSVPVLGRAEWVVIDRTEPWVVRPDSPILTNHPEVVRGLVRRLEGDRGGRRSSRREGVVVFRKSRLTLAVSSSVARRS